MKLSLPACLAFLAFALTTTAGCDGILSGGPDDDGSHDGGTGWKKPEPRLVDGGHAPDSLLAASDGGALPDGGVSQSDSELPQPGGDSESQPGGDSKSLPPDSATPPPDSGSMPPDSGSLPPDSAPPPPDSTPLPSDIGTVAAPTFACLKTAKSVQVVTGHHESKYDPSTAPGKAFDARTADFLNRAIKWGMIHVEGSSSDTSMCWAGGYVRSDKPWDASWDDHKDTSGSTRNSAAITNASTKMVVTGVHYFNVHDGDRTSNAFDWVIQHNWGEYVRDDCLENDHLHSGLVYDTLFDGCYTGISTRPSSDDTTSHGAGQTVTLDQVLLRLQAMPYPYKWTSKSGIIDEYGKPYSGSGVPYGHGNFFKLDSDVSRNPHFVIKNSVFLAVHMTKADKLDFPPASLVDGCTNNTIIWLGPGSYPGKLPTSKFPNCFTIVTGQQGQSLWKQKVTDWHARHPGVGANRKPSAPGSLVFPKKF